MWLSKVGIVEGLFGEDLEMFSPCKEHGSEENACNDLEHVNACEMIGIVLAYQRLRPTIAADQKLVLYYGYRPYPHNE